MLRFVFAVFAVFAVIAGLYVAVTHHSPKSGYEKELLSFETCVKNHDPACHLKLAESMLPRIDNPVYKCTLKSKIGVAYVELGKTDAAQRILEWFKTEGEKTGFDLCRTIQPMKIVRAMAETGKNAIETADLALLFLKRDDEREPEDIETATLILRNLIDGGQKGKAVDFALQYLSNFKATTETHNTTLSLRDKLHLPFFLQVHRLDYLPAVRKQIAATDTGMTGTQQSRYPHIILLQLLFTIASDAGKYTELDRHIPDGMSDQQRMEAYEHAGIQLLKNEQKASGSYFLNKALDILEKAPVRGKKLQETFPFTDNLRGWYFKYGFYDISDVYPEIARRVHHLLAPSPEEGDLRYYLKRAVFLARNGEYDEMQHQLETAEKIREKIDAREQTDDAATVYRRARYDTQLAIIRDTCLDAGAYDLAETLQNRIESHLQNNTDEAARRNSVRHGQPASFTYARILIALGRDDYNLAYKLAENTVENEPLKTRLYAYGAISGYAEKTGNGDELKRSIKKAVDYYLSLPEIERQAHMYITPYAQAGAYKLIETLVMLPVENMKRRNLTLREFLFTHIKNKDYDKAISVINGSHYADAPWKPGIIRRLVRELIQVKRFDDAQRYLDSSAHGPGADATETEKRIWRRFDRASVRLWLELIEALIKDGQNSRAAELTGGKRNDPYIFGYANVFLATNSQD